MTVQEAINKVVGVAEKEIGYLEKKSNKDLDSKTANAGSNNYTKYNRDMRNWAHSASINDQWCQNFVDWCFVTAFGLDTAKKLLYVFTNYTPTGSNAFKKRGRYIKRGHGTPKRGDVIYFYSSAKGRIGHVGIVTKVTSSKVYTIEGNTSGASSLITNGGGVRAKSYSLSSSYVDGYGSVDYAAVFSGGGSNYKLGDRTLQRGDSGSDVKELQEDLVKLDYSFPKYGCDGDFGSETEANVKGFQRLAGIEVDGIFGPESYQALMKMLDSLNRYVEITGESVNVRKGPGTVYPSIGIVHKGDRLPYGGEQWPDGDRIWYLVEFEGQNGCVSSRLSKLVEG